MFAVDQLGAFLARNGMPTEVSAIHREHVESYLEDVLARFKPATAANKYRGLQQFFNFLVDEGEITASPMERMKPADRPEATCFRAHRRSTPRPVKGRRRVGVRSAATPRSCGHSSIPERGSRSSPTSHWTTSTSTADACRCSG